MVCQSRRGNLENQQYEKGPHGLSKAAMMSFQFSSVTQRQSPVDGECRSVLVKHCESRWISGKKITSGSRYFPCLAPCCYIAWIRVPEYLCHKSMALVTMASVFSCGIWKRDWREISYKAHARREYVSGFEKLQRRGPTVHLSVLLGSRTSSSPWDSFSWIHPVTQTSAISLVLHLHSDTAAGVLAVHQLMSLTFLNYSTRKKIY